MVKQMANVIVVMGILIAVALLPGSSAAQGTPLSDSE